MKITIYKKTRLCGILLSLALIVVCVIPATCAFAAETAVAEQDSVHFINPTAITIVGNYLYVADNIEDNKTALLCFDISGNTPILKYTYDKIDGVVIGLSNDKQSKVFLNMGSKVVELNVGGELPTEGKTYAMPISVETNIVDVAYGKIPNISDKTVYALTETSLYQYNETSQLFDIELERSLVGAKAMLSIDEAPNYQLYYLSGTTTSVCNRMNLSNGGKDNFSEKLQLTSGFTPSGILRINNDVALYNNNSICIIEEITNLASITPILTLSENLYPSDCRICDVEAYGDRLFILNSKNKIDLFDKTEDRYNDQPTATIGSDMVDKEVPVQYNSFTLVRPNGYPANIVYKTNADTSVDDIITDAKEYVILGYDGDADSHYYYVLVGDKFGWVKKSDNASSPKEDNKLTIVNNNPSGTENIGIEAKFTSLNAVYIYELPLSDKKHIVDTVNQTASTMKSVKVLQEYKEGDVTWYYVTYDDVKTGFVKKSDVGQLHYVASEKPVFEAYKKINSSLFAPVYLYSTAEMSEEDYVTDVAGNILKLYSGDRVALVKTEGDAAFIMILHDNGNEDYGWIDANKLIDRQNITTNAIVGLCLLAAAVIIATVLLLVYFKRKKKIKRNND